MSKELGDKIKRIRDSYNLSQDRFAYKIGLSGKTISAYETGRTNPPIKILQKIVSVYKTPIININAELKSDLNSKLEILEEEVAGIRNILKDSMSF